MTELTDTLVIYDDKLPLNEQDLFYILKSVANWRNVPHAMNFTKYLFRTGKEQPNSDTALNKLYHKGQFYSADGTTDTVAKKMQKWFLGMYGRSDTFPLYLNEMIYIKPAPGKPVDLKRMMEKLKSIMAEDGYPYDPDDLYVFHLDQDDGLHNVHVHRVYHREKPSLFTHVIQNGVKDNQFTWNSSNGDVDSMMSSSMDYVKAHNKAVVHVTLDAVFLTYPGVEGKGTMTAYREFPKVEWSHFDESISDAELSEIQHLLFVDDHTAIVFADGVCLNPNSFFPGGSQSLPLAIGAYEIHDYLSLTYFSLGETIELS